MSQPPLSRQIQELEEELGFARFVREYHKVALAEAGKAYLAHARQILDQVVRARQEAHGIALGRTGTLRIGHGTHLPDGYLSRVLAAFRDLAPDAAIELLEAPTPRVLQALRQKSTVSDGHDLVSLGEMTQPSRALGGLGMPAFTAYVGLLDIGRPKPGETVVVAAATGAVGSVVGQIAKLEGARVVGIAGGAEKCRHAVETLGFDVCLDRHEPDLPARLAAACPHVIDVYFENVGGAVFDAVLPLPNIGARVPVCGHIADYNSDTTSSGPNRMPLLMASLLQKRIRMQGFVILDHYADRFDAFQRDMTAWLAAKRVTLPEHLVDGLEHAPAAFIGLLAEQDVWHPGVLLTDLPLVFIEPLDRRAEDREIDIDEQLAVSRIGDRVVSGRHDQIADASHDRRRQARAQRHLFGPRRASFFVVLFPNVVDAVMEPERQLDLVRVFGVQPTLREPGEALVEMRQRVILTLRRRVPAISSSYTRSSGASAPSPFHVAVHSL